MSITYSPIISPIIYDKILHQLLMMKKFKFLKPVVLHLHH